MGLGDSDPSIPCSICLDIIVFAGDRATARLKCGHEFHLDCIGSAFNAKGVMECPNCRNVEDGNWRYPNGLRSSSQLHFDDWIPDEDLYQFSYTEMRFGVHWCPIGRYTRIASPLESSSRLPGNSFISSLVPPYTNSQPLSHAHDYQNHSYPGLHVPPYSAPRQSGANSRRLPPVGPPVSLPDPSSFYLLPPGPAASSSRNLQERDRFGPFPMLPVERDSGWWGLPPHHHSNSSLDSSNRVGVWQRNGPDRLPAQQGRSEAPFYRAPQNNRQVRP